MLPIEYYETICDPPVYDRILYPGASDHGWISVTVPQQHYILGLKIHPRASFHSTCRISVVVIVFCKHPLGGVFKGFSGRLEFGDFEYGRLVGQAGQSSC